MLSSSGFGNEWAPISRRRATSGRFGQGCPGHDRSQRRRHQEGWDPWRPELLPEAKCPISRSTCHVCHSYRMPTMQIESFSRRNSFFRKPFVVRPIQLLRNKPVAVRHSGLRAHPGSRRLPVRPGPVCDGVSKITGKGGSKGVGAGIQFFGLSSDSADGGGRRVQLAPGEGPEGRTMVPDGGGR